MSKIRSHFMTTFQMRAMLLSEASLASGEGNIAIATMMSCMRATAAQNVAVAEMRVTK